jgi:alpha-mannosidase
VRTTERSLANGWLSAEVEPLGTLRLVGEGVGVHGAGRLVDGGDQGDTYNYAPPDEDRLVNKPESVGVRTIAAGPLVGELAIERRYAWPLGLADDGRRRGAATAPVLVTTRVELRAGESFARIRVEFGNPSSDHRLRFHVPLPEPADRSAAEGQFAVVERGLQAEGGYGEHPVPTFPARGWVDAGGVAVLLDHVTEYELVDDGRGARELALTLLRSTGLISRNVNRWREDPAGPEVAVPGAQLSGWRSSRFALYPHQGSWLEADVLGAAERYHHPFVTVAGHAAGAADAEAKGLFIDGRGIVLSSLRRRGGWLELRLVAEHPEPTEAIVRGAFDASREADLFGRAGAELRLEAEGILRLPFGPWEIRTVHLRPAAGAGEPPTSRHRR